MTPPSLDWIRRYYAATPLFGLVEILFHVPLRVGSFLSPAWARILYYALCTAAAGAMYRWPRRSAAIGSVESSANIMILVIGFLAPILTLSVDSIQSVGVPDLGGTALVNFLLSGGVSLTSYHLNLRQLAENQSPPA